jgi:hypothetical protein
VTARNGQLLGVGNVGNTDPGFGGWGSYPLGLTKTSRLSLFGLFASNPDTRWSDGRDLVDEHIDSGVSNLRTAQCTSCASF